MKHFIEPFYKSNNKLHKYFVTFILFIRNILLHIIKILYHHIVPNILYLIFSIFYKNIQLQPFNS